VIHKIWYKAPAVQLDPECPYLHLEKPLRVGPFASIGFPGFRYERGEMWTPKPHPFGVVVLEGAALHSHVTIDRGSWRDTFIGKNVRLNNYSHIGHNVRLGDNVIVGVGGAIAGSTEIGDHVEIWSGAKIKERLKIGEGAVIGMGAIVLKDVPPHTTVVGNPARVLRKERKQ